MPLLKKIKKFISHKYLTRMIATCLAFFILPCLLVMSLMVARAHSQLRSANETYYYEVTDSFSRAFLVQLSDFRQWTYRVSLDSRSRKNDAAKLALNEDSTGYALWDAAKTLSSYFASLDRTPFIYYRAQNRVLSSKAVMPAEMMYVNHVNGSAEPPAEFLALFDAREGVRYYYENEMLYIAIPTYLGATRDEAVIIYPLSVSALRPSLFAGAGAADAQFRIYDEQGRLMFMTGDRAINWDVDPNALSVDQSLRHTAPDGRGYTLFARHNLLLRGMTFVSIVPFDRIESSMYAFYSAMKLSLALETLVFLMMGMSMVYVNYLPIRRLTHSIESDDSEDELAGISSAIERLHSDLSEQRLLLMDCLISSLLSGAPVPPDMLRRAGLKNADCACVMTLIGERLDTHDRTALAGRAQSELGATLLITDVLGADHMVIICLMPENVAEPLAALIRGDLTRRLNRPFELSAGPVVESIDDIRLSYAASLEPFAPKKAAPGEPRVIDQLKGEVLEYLQSAYADSELNQVKVADHFGISTYSLSRLFKNHVGVGFSEYVTAKRLEAARELLLTTDESVGQIAAAVGIPNANYFSRLFKANVGLTPVKFRQEAGLDGAPDIE